MMRFLFLASFCLSLVVSDAFAKPIISIQGVTNGQIFVSPESVTPDIQISDTDNLSVDYEILINGRAYVPGESFQEKGYYSLSVYALNEAGEGDIASVEFWIKDLPEVKLTAVTKSSNLRVVDGKYLIDAEVLVASHEIDVRKINPLTLQLWVIDDAGKVMHETPILYPAYRTRVFDKTRHFEAVKIIPEGTAIATITSTVTGTPPTETPTVTPTGTPPTATPTGTPPTATPTGTPPTATPTGTPPTATPTVSTPTPRPTNTVSSTPTASPTPTPEECDPDVMEPITPMIYQNGYVTLRFTGQFPVGNGTTGPVSYYIVGSYYEGFDPAGDLTASSDAQASPDPLQELSALGLLNNDSRFTQRTTPKPKCRWKDSLKRANVVSRVYFEAPYCNSFNVNSVDLINMRNLSTYGGQPTGFAYGYNIDCYYRAGRLKRTDSISSNFDYNVWVEGTCDNPSIEYSGRPKARLKARSKSKACSAIGAAIGYVVIPGNQNARAKDAIGAGEDCRSEGMDVEFSFSGDGMGLGLSVPIRYYDDDEASSTLFPDPMVGDVQHIKKIRFVGAGAAGAMIATFRDSEARGQISHANPGIEVYGSCSGRCSCSGQFTYGWREY